MATTEKDIVVKRARARCEYCQAPEQITGYSFHIEHIQPRNRGGKNELANYALACMLCNRYKSDHLTGLDPITGKEVRLFHPRRDKWNDHFRVVDQIQIIGKTSIGRATANRLKINQHRQMEARRLWVELDLYP